MNLAVQDILRKTRTSCGGSSRRSEPFGGPQCLKWTLRSPFIGVTVDAVIKALRYLQIASVAIQEGGEARTINLCKLCNNAKLVQQGKQPQKSKQWKEVLEKKAHRGRLWKIFGSVQFLRGIWEYFTPERAWARKILADAAQEQWPKTKSIQRSPGAS